MEDFLKSIREQRLAQKVHIANQIDFAPEVSEELKKAFKGGIEKSIGHKYFKREPDGKGNYKYFYTEADYKAGKSTTKTGYEKGDVHNDDTLRDVIKKNPFHDKILTDFTDNNLESSLVFIRANLYSGKLNEYTKKRLKEWESGILKEQEDRDTEKYHS